MQSPVASSNTHTGESGPRLFAVANKEKAEPRDAKTGIAGRLFQQDWWLQASGGDALERVEVKWDGKVVAALCFVRESVYGLRLLKLPPFTRTHGPMLTLPPSKLGRYKRNLRKVVQGLMDALPKHDRFHLFLDPEDPCAFPFAMAGCTIEQDFTFRLPAGMDIDSYWDDLDLKTRNTIRASSKKLEVQHTGDIEVFLEMFEREHGQPMSRRRCEPIRRLVAATMERKQSTILCASDDRGRPAAVSILVWDEEMLFYWQSSRDPAAAIPGANSVLVWEAIKFAVSRGLNFDFDSYHSHAEALFAEKFGTNPIVRPSVIHMNMVGLVAQKLALKLGRKPGG